MGRMKQTPFRPGRYKPIKPKRALSSTVKGKSGRKGKHAGKTPRKALATIPVRKAACLRVDWDSCSEPSDSEPNESEAPPLRTSGRLDPLEVAEMGGCDANSVNSLDVFDSKEQAIECLDDEIPDSLKALQADNPNVDPRWAGVPGQCQWWSKQV